MGRSCWWLSYGRSTLNEQVNTEYFGIETSNKASHKFYLPYRFEAEEGKGLYLHDAFWDELNLIELLKA